MESETSIHFEFVIPRRPLSVQAKTRNLQAWKQYVNAEAAKTWTKSTIIGEQVQLTLVYLYESNPVDTDNIIKPIQDALIGLVYDDDSRVSDVDSHRRPLNGTFDLTRQPALLIGAISSGKECVFVRVSVPRMLEDYL